MVESRELAGRSLDSANTAAVYLAIGIRIRRFSTAGRTIPTVAGWLGATQNSVDDAQCTADSGLNADRSFRAIQNTRSALHTGVTINNLGPFALESEDGVRADLDAQTAAVTLRLIELKRDYFGKIQRSHTNSPASQNPIPQAATPICAGMANRISFLTPDSEV